MARGYGSFSIAVSNAHRAQERAKKAYEKAKFKTYLSVLKLISLDGYTITEKVNELLPYIDDYESATDKIKDFWSTDKLEEYDGHQIEEMVQKLLPYFNNHDFIKERMILLWNAQDLSMLDKQQIEEMVQRLLPHIASNEFIRERVKNIWSKEKYAEFVEEEKKTMQIGIIVICSLIALFVMLVLWIF